jgi:nitrous oxide reductase
MSNHTGTRPPHRRDLLGLAIFGAALAGASAAQAAVAGCDAEDTNPARVSMRKALEYASPSKTPGKVCGGCAFFAGSATNCGKCQLLNNGPVAANAVCSSWAPKK